MSLIPYSDESRVVLYLGECGEVMTGMGAESVDAIVTDPPYELGFMGKKWDSTGIANSVAMWTEALRVLKPGGHLAAFGGTRTYHRMACAIEDAGFEIRDTLAWMYGTGFPKSMDVSKAIDARAGAVREVLSAHRRGGRSGGILGAETEIVHEVSAPATDAARQWEGWGTALKPAYEPIVLARKPLSGTVASNVLQHGTGAINVDACRIGENPGYAYPNGRGGEGWHGRESLGRNLDVPIESTQGRWPANVLLDEEAAALVGEPARFFYTAKASRSEREAGLDMLGVSARVDSDSRDPDAPGSNNPRLRTSPRHNDHPTVKPIAVMDWLCRLITPPGGVVLDPFLGSGTTALAALDGGFTCIGIEREQHYLDIAAHRIAHRHQLELK